VPQTVAIETPHGPARVHLQPAPDPRGVLVLGHGAGGGVGAPDLVAAARAAGSAGFAVALVEQPYRVVGRRSAAPAHQLDIAWLAVCAHLRAALFEGLPFVTGGRSSGARVACRTASATGAAAVLCLAFPLHPPGRPEASRLAELDGVRVPTLVVQGERDPFGLPPARRGRRKVVVVPGTHSLRSSGAVAAAVEAWLRRLRTTG
jgi:predicted alpha/beta-hydrolase family hydrolase